HIVNQSGFAGPGHSSNTRENAEWQVDVDIFQIVLSRAEDLDRRNRSSTGLRDRNRFVTGKIVARQRLGSAGALARCFWRLAKTFPAGPRDACQWGRGARAPQPQTGRDKFIKRSIPNQVAAVFAAARTEINQIVRSSDDLFL